MGIQAAAVMWSQGAKDIQPEDFSMSSIVEAEEDVADNFTKKLAGALGAVVVQGDLNV